MEQEGEKRFPRRKPVRDWIGEQTEEEAAPDPLDRPDLYAEEDRAVRAGLDTAGYSDRALPVLRRGYPAKPIPGLYLPDVLVGDRLFCSGRGRAERAEPRAVSGGSAAEFSGVRHL